MKFDLTLTKRDKQLIEILSVILLAALFINFLILPQWDKYTDTGVKLLEKQQEQQAMSEAIAQEALVKKQMDDAEKEYESVIADFYPMMESHAIERMITKLALDNHLEARDFDISSKPSPSILEPYFASALGLEMQMEGGGNPQSGQTPDAEDSGTGLVGSQEQDVIYSSQVNVTVLGSRENMEQMIDTLYKQFPAVRIKGYSISSENVLDSVSGNKTMMSSLSLELEVYMCEK